MKLADSVPPPEPDDSLSKLDLALQHAANGWHVFPLRPGTKEPLTTHGFKDSSRDPDQIRKWWARWPDGNIGGDCGSSGVTVADLDVKKGGRGPENWAALTTDVTHEPGFVCVTPTGGLHVIWRDDEGVASSVGQVADSVDIKSLGGYIVLEGSEIGGVAYRTISGEPLGRIADLPPISEELRQVARSRKAKERDTSEGTTVPPGSQSRWTLAEYLDNPPVRGDGGTNNWITKVFGHYARTNRDNRAAYIDACREAMALVDPDYEDFDKVLESVWGKEQSKPQPADPHAKAVAEQLEWLIVNEEARLEFAKIKAERDPAQPFDAGTLDHFFETGETTRYRVDGLMLLDGATIVSAKRKTGKTTFIVNLARSLLTGDPFLNTFEVTPIVGRVAVLNFEVTGGQFAHWAGRVGVPGDRMILVNLRGRRNPLAHPQDRAALAQYLREQQVSAVIVDPFSRAFTGGNQNDVSEVGAFLADLDLFTRSEVGATDLVLSVHTGWNGERSRGSSGLEDWPDSIIRLTTKEGDETGPRFLSAIGRDVEVAEDELHMDPATSRLQLTGSGSRKSAAQTSRRSELRDPILAIIRDHPGVKSTDLSKLLRESDAVFQKGDETRALEGLIAEGRVVRRSHRNARQHYLPDAAPQTLPEPGAKEDF